MLKWTTLGVLVTCASLLTTLPATAETGEDPGLSELVEILRKQGVLNDDQYRAVSAKAAQRENENWSDKIEMWGDFRARYEYFDFENDDVQVDEGRLDNRSRFRYRLRLNVKGNVNEHADVFVRLTTGRDGRTTNETLGAKVDFNTDEIFLDKAYVRASPFAEGKLPDGDGSLFFYFGRTNQPWRWDYIFKDWLLWDDELSPAGFYGDYKVQLNEKTRLFTNAGLYYIDENANSKSPKLANLQLGLHGEVAPDWDVGVRGTWFNLSSLDDRFVDRGIFFGNTGNPSTPGSNQKSGLTGDRNGGTANVLEFGAYAKARLIDRWPMLLFADFSTNLDATSVMVTNTTGPWAGTPFQADDEDIAWLIAFQAGDAKEIVRFRLHYTHLEANAFPGQFVDSDIFDGLTNREGWVMDLTKTIMKNTDASLTMFLGDIIESSPAYWNSQKGAERFRLQANMVWKF